MRSIYFNYLINLAPIHVIFIIYANLYLKTSPKLRALP